MERKIHIAGIEHQHPNVRLFVRALIEFARELQEREQDGADTGSGHQKGSDGE